MAEKTNRITAHGRPVWKRKDGSIYSEITTTFETPDGMWITAPAVDENGDVLSDEEVRERIYSKGYPPRDFITGKELPIFEDITVAEDYANWRSTNALNKKAVDKGYPGLKEEPLPPEETGKEYLKRKIKPIVDEGKGFFNYLTNPQQHFGTAQYNQGGLMSRPSMLPSADDEKEPNPENKFGDVLTEFAKEPFQAAKDSFMSAGKIETSDDESQTMKALRPVRRAGDYVKDMGMAGLNLAESGYGVFAGAMGEIFGRGTSSEKRLAKDIMAMPEAFAAMAGGKSITQLDDAVEEASAAVSEMYRRRNMVNPNSPTQFNSFSGMLPPAYVYNPEMAKFTKEQGTRDDRFVNKASDISFVNPIGDAIMALTIPKNGIKGSDFLKQLEKNPSISNSQIPYYRIDKDKRYTRRELTDSGVGSGEITQSIADQSHTSYQRQADINHTGFMGGNREIGYKKTGEISSRRATAERYFEDPVSYLPRTPFPYDPNSGDKVFRSRLHHYGDDKIFHTRSTVINDTALLPSFSEPRPTFRENKEYDRYAAITTGNYEGANPNKRKALILDEIQSDYIRGGSVPGSKYSNVEEVYEAVTGTLPLYLREKGFRDADDTEPLADLDVKLSSDPKESQKTIDLINEAIAKMSGVANSSLPLSIRNMDALSIKDNFTKKIANTIPAYRKAKEENGRFKGDDESDEMFDYLLSGDFDDNIDMMDSIDERLGDILQYYTYKYVEALDEYDNTKANVPGPMKEQGSGASQELADNALKSIIARAAEQGIERIIIPSVDKIKQARNKFSTKLSNPQDPDADVFNRLYGTYLNKSIADLEKNYPVTVHRDVIIPYSKESMDPFHNISMGELDKYPLLSAIYENRKLARTGNVDAIKEDSLFTADNFKSDKGIIIDISKAAEQYDLTRPRFGGERVPPSKSSAEKLGFTEDVFHYSRSSELEGDKFEVGLGEYRGSDLLDSLGVHVGTKQAAEDRFKAVGRIDLDNQGTTLPLKAKTNKPLELGYLNEETGNRFVAEEDEIRNWLNQKIFEKRKELASSSNTNRQRLAETMSNAEAVKLVRQELASEGYTHIPYRNMIEDEGSISYIMLTDRGTAVDGAQDNSAVLRSRFAKFNPDRVKEPEIGKHQGGLI